MRPMLRLTALFAVLGIVLPAIGQDSATPEGPDPKLIQKALAGPYLQGKLVAVDLEKKTFTIEAVIDSKKTINKERQAEYAKLYAQAVQAYRARNKQQYDQLLPQLQAAVQTVYDFKDTTHQFKLRGNNTFQFRIEKLPPREGDDGKIKAYTPAELTKLKGNAGMPGYLFDAKQLDSDTVVRAFLIKETKAKTPAKEEKPKLIIKTAGASEQPKEMMADESLPVSVILVVPPPDTTMPQLPGAPPPPPGANPFVIK